MPHTLRRLTPLSLAALLALTLLPGTPATADHTTNKAEGLTEVGFHNLGDLGESQPNGGDGFNTDVWTWTRDDRLFATVGTWGGLDACPSETDNPLAPESSGVKIVEATDPGNPEMIARLASAAGAQNNDVKILRFAQGTNPEFDGHDILVHSLEPCGANLGPALTPIGVVPREQTGFQLYDVTDPATPVMLGRHNNGGIGTHNLYPYNRPDQNKAYVAAVYNEYLVDLSDVRGELQLVDITDPAAPVQVGSWELIDAEAQGGPTFDEMCQRRGAHLASCNLHDVWVSGDGKTAYLSFWDAGLILLDISDPAAPTFIGQIQSGGPAAEGNTHVAVPVTRGSKEYVVVGDEDFVGGVALGSNGFMARVNSPAPLEADIPGILWTNNASPDTTGVTGDLVHGGTGCTAASYGANAAAVSGNIALIDDRVSATNPADQCPSYTFAQKVEAAETLGAVGLIQVTREGDEPFQGDALTTNIPAMEITFEDGAPVRDAVIAGETVNATIRQGLVPDLPIDPWGYMRVMDVTSNNPANWKEVADFKAPHVEDPTPAPDNVFSAHNPLPGPDGQLYFAWYTDGVRVLDLAPDGTPKETAHFVPLPGDRDDDNDSDPYGVQEDNFGFWGSMAIEFRGDLYVFNSDLNRGLYILRATGGGGGGGCPNRPGATQIVGGSGRDILLGTGAAETICGFDGNDVIRGGGGDDLLLGGRGADRLVGGPGDDVLRGVQQRDNLRGGPGDDVLHGAQGGDRLFGGIGDDRLSGAKGNDRLIGGGGTDVCRGGPGNDRLQACEGGRG